MKCRLLITDLRPSMNLVMMILYSTVKVPEEPATLRVVGSGDKRRIVLQFISGRLLEFDIHGSIFLDDSVNLELIVKCGDNKAVLFKSCYSRNGVIYLDYVKSM
ncbi:MAG: hypothetical protein GXO10_00355 [Crenarchaeota archaeon]|nr:hypothetical protein [Thermoproteota archaeon]